MPSSRGFSQPRDGTQVSCIAGRFFTSVTREAQCLNRALKKIHLPCQLPALTTPPSTLFPQPSQQSCTHCCPFPRSSSLCMHPCPTAHLWDPASIEVAQLFLIFLEMQHPRCSLTFFCKAG